MKQDFDTNNVLGLECDVAEPDQVDPSVNRVLEQFGRIDVMVNNAGIAEFSRCLKRHTRNGHVFLQSISMVLLYVLKPVRQSC